MTRADKAAKYLRDTEVVNAYVEALGDTDKTVKIAILDTGAKLGKHACSLYGSKIKEYRTWLQPEEAHLSRAIPGGHDGDGHGTHSAAAFLKSSPALVEVYIAQVFDKRDASYNVQSNSAVYKTNIANVS